MVFSHPASSTGRLDTPDCAANVLCSANNLGGDQLQAMRWQELNGYRTVDYLQVSSFPPSDDGGPTDAKAVQHPLISHQWRELICEWAFTLVDHFDSSREPVGVGMNFVDRYLGALVADGDVQGPMSKRDFKLLCLTCLHLAFKLQRLSAASLDSLLQLNQDQFTRDQIIAMERQVLQKLQWKVHPPTSFDFLASCHCQLMRSWLPLLQEMDFAGQSILEYYSDTILESARFLVELSVIDYFFVLHRPSHIAVAALLNALEDVYGFCNYQYGSPHAIVLSWLDPSEWPATMSCKVRLRAIQSNVDEDEDATTTSTATCSPPCSSLEQHDEEEDYSMMMAEAVSYDLEGEDDISASSLLQAQQQPPPGVSPVNVLYPDDAPDCCIRKNATTIQANARH